MTLSVDERLDLFSKCFCVPVSIIVNFSLFQYLVTVFHSRRHDPHVRLLLVVSFLSFAALIPFAYPDADQVRNLNDMSEVCSVLTFTQQIAILARGVNKKMKLKALVVLGKFAELLVLLGLALLVFNVVQLAEPTARALSMIKLIDDIIEYAAIVFVVCFRFFFLSLVRGWKHIFLQQKLEMFYYFLFVTHAVVFHAVGDKLDLDLHHVKGLWMRITISLCLWPTIRAKMTELSSLNKSRGMTSVADRRSRVTTAAMKAVTITDDHDEENDSDIVATFTQYLKRLKKSASSVLPTLPSQIRDKRGPHRILQQLASRKSDVVVRLPSTTGSFRRRFSRSKCSSTKVTAKPISLAD